MGFRRFMRFLASLMFMVVIVFVVMVLYRMVFGTSLNTESIGGMAVLSFLLVGSATAVNVLLAKYHKGKSRKVDDKQ